MSMTAQFDENMGGVSRTNKHRWGDPMPGAGSMKICQACGEKLTPITTAAECQGRPATGLSETIHDYEPT